MEDRFIMECKVYSKKHERISAISKQSIIPYNYDSLSKSALPIEWRNAISKIEDL